MRSRGMKCFYLTVLLCCATIASQAQFTEANIGVNGLTCSQCTRSVEMRIRKLDFVQDVQMDLQHTKGRITFKPHEKADISKVADAVRDAGFSVRFVHASFNFDHTTVSDHNCFSYGGDTYQFVKPPKEQPKGVAELKFAGPGFMPKKELHEWQTNMKSDCDNKTGKLYYITL